MMKAKDDVLTLTRAAKEYGVRRDLLVAHINAGLLRPVKGKLAGGMGRPSRVLVRRSEVVRWLKERENPPDNGDKRDPYLPLKDIAELIRVQPARLYRAVDAGELEHRVNTSYNPGRGRQPYYLIRLSAARAWKIAQKIGNRRKRDDNDPDRTTANAATQRR